MVGESYADVQKALFGSSAFKGVRNHYLNYDLRTPRPPFIYKMNSFLLIITNSEKKAVDFCIFGFFLSVVKFLVL